MILIRFDNDDSNNDNSNESAGNNRWEKILLLQQGNGKWCSRLLRAKTHW